MSETISGVWEDDKLVEVHRVEGEPPAKKQRLLGEVGGEN